MTVKDFFNKSSMNYDAHCNLQLETGNRLLSLINNNNDIVMDIGCGTGLITSKLIFRRLYCLDISEKMLFQAEKKLGIKDIFYIQGSFDELSNFNLDLAFANMSLQWSDDLEFTLNNIKNNLKRDASLVFSIPLKETFSDLDISKLNFYSMEEVKSFLSKWQIIHASSENIQYNFPNLIASLRSIKAVGANHCKHKSSKLISRDKSPHLLKYEIGYFMVKNI